jgi:hypothetical protein
MTGEVMQRLALIGVFGCAFVVASFALAQPVDALHGDVVAIEGSRLHVKSDAGQEVTLALPDNVRITVRAPVAPGAIRPGDFIGTTAAAQADGTLRASEVRIFPESMRGTGEGHRPMPSKPGSTMTNATVSGVSNARSTMTNATVEKRDEHAGEVTLKLAYRGGEQTVVVPRGAPIMTFENGDRGSLVPGAHVVVYASPGDDGGLIATRISVGKNGWTPPL